MLYVVVAFIFSLIPASVKAETHDEKKVDIYILSNGVHSEFVVPVQSKWIDWSKLFPYANTKGKNSNQQYVGIGWGDKGFYLQTPEWKDLKASVAFRAAFGLSESALHVTYYQKMIENELCIPVQIDSSQYKILIDYVLNSIDVGEDNKPICIETNAQYGLDDAFYEAKGSYNLFFTCNTWTNTGLKRAKMPAAVWTIFESGVMNKYKK